MKWKMGCLRSSRRILKVRVPAFLLSTAQLPIVLDEAFPEITIDLVCHFFTLGYMVYLINDEKILVAGSFEPANVASLAHHLKIPPALMFMTCPGPDFPYSVAEFGTRITSL